MGRATGGEPQQTRNTNQQPQSEGVANREPLASGTAPPARPLIGEWSARQPWLGNNQPMEPATSSSGARQQQNRPPETEEEMETQVHPGVLGTGPRESTDVATSSNQKQKERVTPVGEPVQFDRPQGDIMREN